MPSLFVADDEEQSVFWRDEHDAVALFTPDPAEAVRCIPPPAMREQPGFALRFARAELDLPRGEDPCPD